MRFPKTARFVCLSALAAAPAFAAEEKIDFIKQVKPLLEGACTHCHGEKEDKGDFRMHTLEDMIKGNENGPGLTPKDLTKSAIYTTLILPADDDMVMPPSKEGMLEKSQIEVIKKWIEQGADWPAGRPSGNAHGDHPGSPTWPLVRPEYRRHARFPGCWPSEGD